MGAVYLIENAGFEVYEAASADAAIALFELHKEIRLIFTGVDIPESVDGLKLARYIRGRWPPVKIIVTSGHVKVNEEHLPADALFIPKPYDAAEITQERNDSSLPFYVAWTGHPRVAVTARKIKTFRMTASTRAGIHNKAFRNR
jgi:Response regulator receiver domain